jgi:SpoVK/Ycf46/Vps4 family AAA+-type ATPase
MYKAVVSRGRLDSRDVDAILSEKEQIISRVFGKYLGESEERMRKAIAVAEGVAPAILWVDELEKALAGATGGGGDSGVSSRVFGSLLTWMEEKDNPCLWWRLPMISQGFLPSFFERAAWMRYFLWICPHLRSVLKFPADRPSDLHGEFLSERRGRMLEY